MFNKLSIYSSILCALVLSIALSGNAYANTAKSCKGMEQKICLADATCSWVNGYERSDGKKVSSFCRTKAKSKTASAKTQPDLKKS